LVNQLVVRELQTNCWITTLSGADCVVIDPGGDGELILERLKKLSLSPKYFVLTHAHFDHLAALPFLAAAFPEAGIAIHREEADKLGARALEQHRRDFNAVGYASYVETLWEPMPDATLLLSDGDALGSFTVMHLPGHSPGSIALYNEAEKNLFSGDTLFRGGVGRTDLPGGDEAALYQSLRRLCAMDGDINVYPGHGPMTTIGREALSLGLRRATGTE
jgi:glyoxylase-like metal-dependent hydrolase (beta-lactamase superfamily II)